MFQGREEIVEARRGRLRAGLLDGAEARGFPARTRDRGPPLTVTPLKASTDAPGAKPQHIQEIVRLRPVELDLAPLRQIGGHKQAWCRKVIGRHVRTASR
jgi:hypothetical protein